MKNKIDGRHLILPASIKGGVGKSSTVVEIVAGLTALGIPTIVANMEVPGHDDGNGNDTLKKMLRSNRVHNLELCDASLLSESLSALMEVQDKLGAVMIMDVPAGVTNAGNEAWSRLMDTYLIPMFDTVTLVGCVTNNETDFAHTLHITNAVNHPNKHILYRGRDLPGTSPLLINMIEWQEIQKSYPCYYSKTRHRGVEQYIMGQGDWARVPDLSQLSSWLSNNKKLRPQEFGITHAAMQAVMDTKTFLELNYLPILQKYAQDE